MDLQDATSRYLAQLLANGRSPYTHAQHARHLHALDEWLAAAHRSRALAEISPEVIAAFLVSDAVRLRPDGNPKRAASVNCLRSSVRCFTSYCHDAGYTAADAGRLVKRARCSPAPPRAPSESDLAHLLATIGKGEGAAARRDRMLVRFLAATGARITSALHVRKADVDIQRGEVLLNRTKNSSPHVVPLSRELARELAVYMRTMQGEMLFPARGGGPMCSRQAAQRLADWLEAAGLGGRFSAHGLRHFCAMTAYERTKDLLLVKELMGHKSIVSTCTYARAGTGALRAAARS